MCAEPKQNPLIDANDRITPRNEWLQTFVFETQRKFKLPKAQSDR